MSSKLGKYNHKIFSQCFVRSCAIILKYSLNIKNQKGIKNCTVFFSGLIKYSWCIVSLGYCQLNQVLVATKETENNSNKISRVTLLLTFLSMRK